MAVLSKIRQRSFFLIVIIAISIVIYINEARKMILELDPSDRPLAKWQENEIEVAKPTIDQPNSGYLN